MVPGSSAASFDRLFHIISKLPSNTRPQPIAISESAVNAAPGIRWKAVGIGGSAGHAGTMQPAQGLDAVNVVVMVVGDQDLVKAPAALGQRLDDWW